MLEIAIMLEGQNGLTWPRWQNIVRLVEDLGFVGTLPLRPFHELRAARHRIT